MRRHAPGLAAWLARLTLVAASLLLAASSAAIAGATPTFQGNEEIVEDAQPEPVRAAPQAQFDAARFVNQVVALVNVERAKEGAPALQANEQLVRAAQDYAAVIGGGTCFEHTCPPDPQLRDRIAKAGQIRFNRIGENIAAGDRTPEDVVAGWMGSPGHRRNILNPGFAEIGVGVVQSGGEFGIYWVQAFGTRAQ